MRTGPPNHLPSRKVLLLDGFNLAFRSFYAVPELSRPDGFPTNALHGWLKTIWHLADRFAGAEMLAVFDLDGDHMRQELCPEYKANRSQMPEALRRQLEPLKQLARLTGVACIEESGVEADDIIATLAKRMAEAGRPVWIVSADKDLGQCVGGLVRQLLPPPTANPRLGWRDLDAGGVEEKFGVSPAQIADYLALVGDTSDNVRGLDGVGPKTAAAWLRANRDIEGIIARCGMLKPKRFQGMVHAEQARLRRNLQLTRLRTDRPAPVEPGVLDLPGLLAFLESMEMRTSRAEAQKRYGTP